MERLQVFLKKISWVKLYCILSYSLFIFLIEISIYKILIINEIKQFWILLPIVIYIIESIIIKHIKRIQVISISLEISSILSLLLLFISIHKVHILQFLENYFEMIAVSSILALFINLFISQDRKFKYAERKIKSSPSQLFNLFYLNISKAHEIAMLINNKIMKTIEREQISEALLKYNASTVLGSKDIASVDVGYSMEDNSKKRVYENFDVKTTKSIMLRTIYETAQKKENNIGDLKIGDLALFKNIELKQRNIDDTVMILNILQDSQIKNQSNDNIEINVNKMMDKMLDDFTIDYTFTYKQAGEEVSNYIIQIPYKAVNNFENGYQHNDLQLGKLSLLGIYRGEVDFSKRESISSKFLEIISNSYNQQYKNKEKNVEMKMSLKGNIASDIQFEFHHEKLTKKMRLIDTIAIIQELNFDRNE